MNLRTAWTGFLQRPLWVRVVCVVAVALSLLAIVFFLVRPAISPRSALEAELLAAKGDFRVAAEVDGAIVYEGQVTERVIKHRLLAGLEEPDAWASWLVAHQTDEQAFRQEKLEDLLHQEVVERSARQAGVSVAEGEVTAEVEAAREAYLASYEEFGLGPEEQAQWWTQALAENGEDEEVYRAHVRTYLLERRLAEVSNPA